MDSKNINFVNLNKRKYINQPRGIKHKTKIKQNKNIFRFAVLFAFVFTIGSIILFANSYNNDDYNIVHNDDLHSHGFYENDITPYHEEGGYPIYSDYYSEIPSEAPDTYTAEDYFQTDNSQINSFQVPIITEDDNPILAVNIPIAEGSSRMAEVYVVDNPGWVNNPQRYIVTDFSYTAIYLPHYRDIIVTISPPQNAYFNYYENDFHRRPMWHEYREEYGIDVMLPMQITPPHGYTIIETTVFGNGYLHVRMRPVFTITFHLRGGYISPTHNDPVVLRNRLQGCFIQLGEGDAVIGHPVWDYPFFDAYAMPQRGVPQPDPERINSRFRGWREVDTYGEIIDSDILSSQDVADLRVTGDRYFEAVYTLHLIFYKVDATIYNEPFNINAHRIPLQDAIFELRLLDETVIYTTTLTLIDGKVEIGGCPNPPDTLILPPAPPEDIYFKLVETQEPDGFMEPEGYWLITFNTATGEIVSITEEDGNFEFIWRALPMILMMNAPVPAYTSYDGEIGNAPEYTSAHGRNQFNDTSSTYIPFVPFSPVQDWPVIIRNPHMLEQQIWSIPANGITYRLLLDFPANIATSTDYTPVSPIHISSGVSIILDSLTDDNQVWNRNQSSGRHFNLQGGSLELRNVTLSRSAQWAEQFSSFNSGGVQLGGTLIMNHPNATISNNRATHGGGVAVFSGSSFTMHEGNIINNIAAQGGGIYVDGADWFAYITIAGGRISNNTGLVEGGGIGMCCYSTIRVEGDAQIYNNTAGTGGGGGVHLGGAQGSNTFIMDGNSSIHSNHTDGSGGGIHRGIDLSSITIHGGSISLNTANHNGGGVFITPGWGAFTMHEGSITRNWAGVDGGGVFVSHDNNQSIPGVIVANSAVFRQNIAGRGMRVSHQMHDLNAQIAPGTITVDPTEHVFTNHDFNAFGPEYAWHVGNLEIVPHRPDWVRLNDAINENPEQPTTIIIHPEGSPGITEGMADSTTFYLLVSDPHPDPGFEGRTITTVPIDDAPTNNPHRILIDRDVTIQAATDEDIVLLMAVPQASPADSIYSLTSDEAPWLTTNFNPGRHFIIDGGGSLTFGGGSGTIEVHGNTPADPPLPPVPPLLSSTINTRGGIDVINGGQLTLDYGSMVRNSRRNDSGNNYGGGGITLVDGHLTMYPGSRVYSNIARFNGGGIYATGPGSEITLNGGEIHNNSALINWGAGSTATNHIPADLHGGGGIRVNRGGTLTMNDGAYIHNNRAHRGGGVRIYRNVTFTMNGGEIHSNWANWHGSSVPGSLANNAHGSNGGGVFVDGVGAGLAYAGYASTFYMNGGEIHNNEARHYAAGVYLRNHAVMYMRNDAVIKENDSIINHSGGVFVHSRSRFEMFDYSEIKDNTSFTGAAGVRVETIENLAGTQFIIHGGTISGNIVEGNNANYSSGGGVRIMNNTSVTMHYGHIYNNRSLNGFGGGVWVGGGPGTWANATFTMNGGVIENNRAYGTGFHTGFPYGGGGGGVLLHSQLAVFTMNGGQIYNNYSALDGGGVHITPAAIGGNGGTFYFNEGLIDENEARNGGGVFSRRGIFNMRNVTANGYNNISQIHENIARNNGGGVYIHSTGYSGAISRNFVMEGGFITYNEADYLGGGVYVTGEDSTFTMTGGMIGGDRNSSQGNTAVAGGGVFLQDNAAFTMDPGNATQGGATIETSGTIAGNTSIGEDGTWSIYGGGGIAIAGGSTFTLNDGMIGGITPDYGNTARHHGGGVFMRVSGGTFNMTGGYIRNNIASTEGFIISGIDHDGTGGGVHFESLNNFTMTGGYITENTAYNNGGGVLANGVSVIDGGTISYNQATFGAGIVVASSGDVITQTYISNGHLTMIDGTIHGNEADEIGGGIVVAAYGTFIMEGGTVSGNEADYAGGMTAVNFMGAGPGTIEFHGGTISGNIARYNGGGVWLSGMPVGTPEMPSPSTGVSTFTIHGADEKIVTGNEAMFGGGFYVTEDALLIMEADAANLAITHNAAEERGGGIFTEAAEYNNPLTRLTGDDRAYHNLFLRNVYFSGNMAGHREFSPFNALDVVPRPVDDWESLSLDIHPFNNYDINFIGRFDLPQAGGTGTSILLATAGTMFLVVAAVGIIFLKKRRAVGL